MTEFNQESDGEPREQSTLSQTSPPISSTTGVIIAQPAQDSFSRSATSSKSKFFWLIGGFIMALVSVCALTVIIGTYYLRGQNITQTWGVRSNYTSAAAPQATATPLPIPQVNPPEDGVDYETAVLINIYAQVNPSVVNVTVLSSADVSGFTFRNFEDDSLLPLSNGSGFVWDAEGHIVTNNHVVEGAEQVQVTFSNGTVSIAEVIGNDVDSDLAVLRIDPEGYDLRPVRRGSSDNLRVGMRVAAIGNPFGFEGTLTSGIISAIGRSIPARRSFQIPGAIQTDTAINPGNSGGPLLNEQGEVIGVNAQIRSEVRANSGVGFSIPIGIVERVVPALIANGIYQHSYIGVSGETFSPICAEDLGLSKELRGALVIQVLNRTPASRAGLRGAIRASNTKYVGVCPENAGGDLITAIDDHPVTTFHDVLIYLQRFTSPGDTVILSVLREGEQMQIDVRLTARPR